MKQVWFAAMVGILAIVAIGTLTPSTGWAVDRAEAEETARLLAKLLKAGRLVIEQNQQLIDDQHKGDKGFTPEVFEQQLVQEFRQQTGIDLSKLQARLRLSRCHPSPRNCCRRSCSPARKWSVMPRS